MSESHDQFKLSGDGSFASRSNDIFGSLDVIEKKHEAKERAREKFSSDRHKYMKDDPALGLDNPDSKKASSSRHDHSSPKSGWSKAARDYEDRRTYRDRDRDGSEDRPDFKFKVPRGRASRGRFVPDHKKNPHKYTRYDLSDVTTDHMSNSTNTAAAFDFLRQRRELKDQGNEDEAAADISKPVVFNRPKKTSQAENKDSMKDESPDQDDDQPNVSYQSGKFKMAEYVVGQGLKKSKDKIKSAGPASASDKVGLQHLFEEEEEDSDDSDSINESTSFKNRSIRKRTHSSDEDS